MPASPPGPRPLPLLGHLPWIARSSLTFMLHLGRTYGDLSRFWIGPKELFFVNHPELIREVLQNQRYVRTQVTRDLLASFLGEGVFSQEGQLHLQQRRLMQPAFHHKRIAGYAQDMLDVAYGQLDEWRPGETRDLVPEMMRLTFAIVARALFSTDTSAEARAVHQGLRDVQAAIDSLYEIYTVLPAGLPIVRGPRMRRAVRQFQSMIQRIVAERRAAGDERSDLLGMLLAARDEDGTAMSDAQLAGQSLSILFAGHETTSNTLCWAWHLLSQHPAVLERVRAEVEAVAGERPLVPADYPRLVYTGQVISETLRLMPPAWWAERTPLEDSELGGYPVRAGTPVVISVYVAHRDPRFFPNPSRFDPERFAPERAALIPRFAYLPFGAGSHVCIGNSFALMEARLVLAAMVQRVQLEPVPGHVPVPRAIVTMGVANGLPMRVLAPRPALAEV